MAFQLPGTFMDTCTDGFLYCIAVWANNVTQGFFWTALLIGFVAVLAISTQRFGGTRSFGFASFTGMIGAIWLATLQLMPWWIASAFILVGVIGIATLVLNER